MCAYISLAIAALILLLAWQPTDVAAQSQQARSYNYCWQLAYNRGWERKHARRTAVHQELHAGQNCLNPDRSAACS